MSFLSQRIGDKLAKFEQRKDGGSDLGLVSDLTLFSVKHFLRTMTNQRVKSGCLNVGLVFNGGIGDQIIQLQWARVFVESLAQQGCVSYNVFMFNNSEIGQMLLKRVEHVDLVECHHFARKHKFDLLLSLEYYPRLWDVNLSAIKKYAPFLSDKLKLAGKFYSEFLKFNRVTHHYQLMDASLAKHWNRYDLLGQCGLCDFNRDTQPFFGIDQSEVDATLSKYHLHDKEFLTVQSGIGDMPLYGIPEGEAPIVARQRATKLIPKELATQVFIQIKQRYPELLIVQLGDEHSVRFDGVDLCLLGQTSLPESINLLYAAKLHFGNDSGLIHLRHAMGKRSVVVWGPTSAEFLGYPEDQNIQGACKPCMWLTRDWNVNCPKGLSCAKCMLDIPVNKLIAGVEKILSTSTQL